MIPNPFRAALDFYRDLRFLQAELEKARLARVREVLDEGLVRVRQQLGGNK